MTSCESTATYTAKDFKSEVKPVWCPGCGDYAVLSSITKAFADLGLAPHQTSVVSGIGCSSRIPAYTNTYGIHSIHGRALAVGQGLKLGRPDLTVLVAGGDGDGFSIGGNHFLHACRRNVDITYIVMDNRVYGMTKGQPSPTTESDWDASAMAPPGGTGMTPFHPLAIALASGANFIARGFSGDPNGTAQIIAEAIKHPGFSFVAIMSPCITFREEQRDWKNTMRNVNIEPTTDPAQAARRLMTDDGFNCGILYRGDRPAYGKEKKATNAVSDLDREFTL
ncbi:2-oxoglutarate oxidoreductase beta subunit [Paramagnetospirillum magnetotacticum MS-1]|uniref:2-oxoglutarate oxidoreductase beta subunit n=1 Tax=Paramagnetospirillum magnetotacticum MS-1 TaxID=272627 RepID=A0A0C2YFV1_PARME|nr:2-oxoacid:ferredoxin oxidoreductase subunit beta [Paramagnetospirillum magnetotacticum]KIL98594.1 2-oxoglutarate oxidoreductase beta subunit [Paramagnetospirillum magnetotacticum MS-1]